MPCSCFMPPASPCADERRLQMVSRCRGEREMLSPTSSHSNKLILGRPTDARRPEPRTAKYRAEKQMNKTKTSSRPAISPRAVHIPTRQRQFVYQTIQYRWPTEGSLHSAHHVMAAVQALRDKVNNTPLIGLIYKASHRVVPSGILVSNMRKCRTFENHVLHVPPPVLTPGAQTCMAWERIRPMASHVTG